MINVSLVGSGRWSRNLAKSFAKKVRIKSVSSTGNKENLKKMREVVPKISVASLDEILLDEEVDAVIIATPIECLADIAVKCLKSRKHVFLEKPGAVSKKQIDLLRASKKDRVCLINYIYLSDPAYLFFKKEISKKKILNGSFVWQNGDHFTII